MLGISLLIILVQYVHTLRFSVVLSTRFVLLCTSALKITSHIIVQQKSRHPTQTKMSLAYNFGLRIIRICENEDDYSRHRSELTFQLNKCGKSGRSVDTQLLKVDRMDILQLLQKDVKR